MYKTIVNPESGRKVSLYKKKGQAILLKYLQQSGGEVNNLPEICAQPGPCWKGYVYIGPKPKVKGSCIKKSKLCKKRLGKGTQCKSKINCKDISPFEKKNTNYKLKKYTGGALCPQNNSAIDIYNLTEAIKCEGSQTWLLYKDATRDDVIIKKLGPVKWLTEDTIIKEIEATTKAGDLGIGPEVVFSTICQEERGGKTYAAGYIVMKFIQGRTLKKKDLRDKDIVDEINMLLLKMHDYDMKHDDLHNGNIMIGYTKKTDDATPIDSSVLINERVWIIDHSGSEPTHGDSQLTHLNIEWNDD